MVGNIFSHNTNNQKMKTIPLEFCLADYKPVDYRKWKLGEEASAGANLIHLLNDEEIAIWNEAKPYQDSRNDPGHGEFVTYFTIQLLPYFEADRSIVIPAAIMHDIGWYKTDINAWKNAVKSGDTEGEAKRRPHQNRSVGLAGKILDRVGYSERCHFPIFDIIGDHDTRKLPPTTEAKVVWDADMLWRVTLPEVLQHTKDEGANSVLTRLERVAFMSAPHDLSSVAEQIARLELANTMVYRFPEDASKLLGEKYKPELERMKCFYQN